MSDPLPVLLAIIAVEREDAVRCMAPSCDRVVHKRIHIVRHEGRCLVLGSECFRVAFEQLRRTPPRYSSRAGGERLSERQRDLLIMNTEALVAEFEADPRMQRARPATVRRRGPASVPYKRPQEFSDAQRRAAEPEVRRLLARMPSKDGIDYDLPGWRGDLNHYVTLYLRGEFGRSE